MGIENSSMSIKSGVKGSKNTPQKPGEENIVFFDINDWENQEHSAINQSGDFGGNTELNILSEKQQIQIQNTMKTPKIQPRTF